MDGSAVAFKWRSDRSTRRLGRCCSVSFLMSMIIFEDSTADCCVVSRCGVGVGVCGDVSCAVLCRPSGWLLGGVWWCWGCVLGVLLMGVRGGVLFLMFVWVIVMSCLFVSTPSWFVLLAIRVCVG